MDLNECKAKKIVKKIQPNKSKAISILQISDIKEKTILKAQIDNETINAYLPMAYDSLREVLEAICLLEGYQVENHVCIGALLKELIKDFNHTDFERFRYARNGINYYGTKIDFEQGKELIKKMLLMRKDMKKIVVEGTK